ncbi:MAG: hypothetical protein RQ739_00235 [Desulfotignum sp.]|nr:hypothetical protein [Desulfotignum sp.]
MKMIKVTVCELPDTWTQDDTLWNELKKHLASAGSDLLVLPEMPFSPWITRSDRVDSAVWDKAVSAHESWIGRLAELPAAMVAGAFCLSSNFNGPNVPGEDFSGAGWIIEPERGVVRGLTDPRQWILTLDVDLEEARAAKQTYPRYVRE